MRSIFFIICVIAFVSCSKNTTLENVPPPTAQSIQDSSKLFLITASANSTGTSMIAYDNNKTLRWEQSSIMPLSFWSMPTFRDDKLFYTSSNKLVSINSTNGSNFWTYTSSSNLINPNIINDTLVTASSIIAPSNQNQILLINKSTGTLIWNKIITDQPLITPKLDNGKVFVLTTNSTGTIFKLTAYSLSTQNIVWQTTLANAFLTNLPSQMLVKNDTLIVAAPSNKITVMNKNNGTIYWSKSLNATSVFFTNNTYVYNDVNTGCLTRLSSANGNILFQSAPSNAVLASSGNKLTYIYNNAIYYQSSQDTLYCTNLSDGVLKWKKPCHGYYEKIIIIGQYAYGAKLYDNNLDELKLMILKADDFSPKDSIIVPKRDYKNFSVVSTSNEIF